MYILRNRKVKRNNHYVNQYTSNAMMQVGVDLQKSEANVEDTAFFVAGGVTRLKLREVKSLKWVENLFEDTFHCPYHNQN